MKPTQCIDINDWVACTGGLPLGNEYNLPIDDLNVEVLFECEMDPHGDSSYQNIITVSLYKLKITLTKFLILNAVAKIS